MQKPRLLYIINKIHAVGGGEIAPCRLASLLVKHCGYEVSVAYLWKPVQQLAPGQESVLVQPETESLLEETGIPHHWLGGVDLGEDRVPGFSRFRRRITRGMRYVPYIHQRLRRVIAATKPDIIHCFGVHAALFSFFQQHKCIRVRTVQNQNYYESHSWVGYAMAGLVKRHFKQTVFVGNDVYAHFQKKYPLQRGRSSVIFYSIEERFFENSRPRKHLPKAPYKLGIFGRLAPVKGHAFAMTHLDQLAAEYPIELYIAGDGPLKEKLRAQAKALKHLKVHFMGALSGDALVRHYDEMDVQLIPSLWEGFPVVIQEGAARALPLVGSDVCGAREFLRHLGFAPFAIGDGAGFIGAIKKLLGDEESYTRFSAKSIAFAESFRPSRMAEGYDTLYTRLCADKIIKA